MPACHVTINQSQRTVNIQMWYLIIEIFILKSQVGLQVNILVERGSDYQKVWEYLHYM